MDIKGLSSKYVVKKLENSAAREYLMKGLTLVDKYYTLL